jgi:carboxyl-terminal processing protease
MEYANTKGVKPNQKQFNYSQSIIKFQLKALIARNIWGNEGFYAVIEKEDLMIKKALELLK